jgi:hypothetical protein
MFLMSEGLGLALRGQGTKNVDVVFHSADFDGLALKVF